MFFGHFGVGNLGNDATLEAAVVNVRQRLPEATITCICRGPQVIREAHGIEALPMDINEDRRPGRGPVRRRSLPERLLSRIWDEGQFWTQRTRWFRSVDQFIVIGTGAIYDGTAPWWNVAYDLYKWCAAARLGGARVRFVSVGAGPITHPMSRALMLRALRLADFRSYRDQASFEYLQSVGFDTSTDRWYPDTVFSLPTPPHQPPAGDGAAALTIGVGVMAYYGPAHDTVGGAPLYRSYVDRMKQFVAALLSAGYRVRLLTGDLENDPQPAEELLNFARDAGVAGWHEQIVSEPIGDVHELMRQVAQTDLVVAARFHNLVAAMMLGRPVISVGFHRKSDALMADMGLDRYACHIETFGVDDLTARFRALVAERQQVADQINARTTLYRQRLDEQYAAVLPGRRGQA